MPERKPKSFQSEGIVAFGKRIFDDYYSKKISLKKLIRLIDESGARGNDIAVLGCYCEQDVEVTYQLHKLEQYKMAKENHDEYFKDEPFTIKITAMMVMTELENLGASLDRYFKCDRFAKMILREHRRAWGDDYPKLVATIEAKVKHFNFPSWNHNFEKYIK